jgi:hypothetical protein
MRTLTLLLLVALLGAGCASSDGLDANHRDCDAGSDLSVNLALNIPGVGSESAIGDQLTVVVAVDNNTDVDVEVVAIRIDPGEVMNPSYRISNSYREFKRTLPARGDADFELPVTGRSVLFGGDARGRTTDATIPLAVTVVLGNGTVYRCKYEVPSPRV